LCFGISEWVKPDGSHGGAMSFGIYAVGFLILIAGLAYLAHLIHIPEHYIIAMAIILFGLGVVMGVQNTRQKDPN
jgi:hypothetical protein